MNARENESSYFYNIATLTLGVLILIPTVLAILSLSLFKKKKSKEDVMHLQKLSIKILLYFSYLVVFMSYLLADENEEDENNILSKIQTLIFSVCLLSLGLIDLKLNYEKYMKFYDPTFVINDFITQRAKNFTYEVFYVTFAVLISIISFNFFNFDSLLQDESNRKYNSLRKVENILVKFKANNQDVNHKMVLTQNFLSIENAVNKSVIFKSFLNSTESVNGIIGKKYLFSCLIIIYPILLILTIGSFILKIKQLKMMTSISQDYKYNSLILKDVKLKKKVELFETIFIIFNFLYSICSIFLAYFIYKLNNNNQYEDFEYEYNYQLKILSLYFLVIDFLEAVFFMFYISRTDFYKFTLGNTSFAKIYSIFLPDVVEKPTISIDSSFNNFNTNIFYKERAKELNSTCMFFHNNLSYSMDEIFVNMFDNTINIIFASITKIISEKAKNGPFNISKSANNLLGNSNRPDNINNNNNFNYNNNYLNEVHIKNGFYSEEEYDSETDKRQINSKSFTENLTGDPNPNTNGNLNFKETEFKTSLISENERHKESHIINPINKRTSNKAKNKNESNSIKHHEIKISESYNDLKDERLLRLININAEKEHVHFGNKYSNDPSYQRIRDDNQNNAPSESFSNRNHNYKNNNIKGDISSQRKEDLSYLLSGMNLNIEIKEYYEKEFQEILSLKKINFSQLEKSFMSHYNHQQNNFVSLFSNNAREELFKKQDNLVIRTNDKLYNFEFLTNCEENLNEDTENGNLFRYTRYLRERESTFLPYIIGVYKIKINNMKELKIVISKNNLIDEIPKENFNYWQLVRIKEKDSFQMITSSKDRQSLLVSDEILIKGDTKFNMVNYNDFGKILFSDLEFLRRINSANYSLLIMYYEMGKNAAHNSQNSVSDDEIRNFKEKYGRMSNTSNNGMNNTNNNISAIKPFGEPSAMDFSLKNDLNLIQIANGFQADVNEFRCILFFMFDNIFKKNKFYDFKNLCSSKHEKFELMARTKFNEIKD